MPDDKDGNPIPELLEEPGYDKIKAGAKNYLYEDYDKLYFSSVASENSLESLNHEDQHEDAFDGLEFLHNEDQHEDLPVFDGFQNRNKTDEKILHNLNKNPGEI